jgi:quercetin dioxygenase-like cupin family protein
MKIVRPKSAFKDARGAILDILDGVPVECVTLLSSKRGAIRGNHYHRKTTQYLYVLEGRLRAYAQRGRRAIETRVVRAGDMVVTPPGERHAFEALEDSRLLACAHGPRAGRSYEEDTYRLDEPLTGKRRRA